MNRAEVLAALTEINVEVAWGADQSTSPLSWDWTRMDPFTDAKGTVRARVLGDALDIRTGYSDETRGSPASSVELELDNSDGAWTPGNPLSPWYPHVEEGTPLRVVMPAGTSYLLTDGDEANFARTPDDPTLDITGAIDLRYDGDIDWWSGMPVSFVAKDDGPNSYLFWISVGFPIISWSPDGSSFPSLVPAVKIPWVKGRHALRCLFRPNNGLGGKTARFEYGDSLDGPWTLLDEVTEPGTTSIFSGSSPLDVGRHSSTIRTPIGRTYGARVYAGTVGVDLRAAPSFEAQTPGTTSFTDPAARTWTLQGDAEIADRHVLFSGQVDEIHPEWIYDEPLEARVNVVASGELRRLAQGDPPLDSVLFRAVTSRTLGTAVKAYWPFEDPSTATAAATPIPGAKTASVGPVGGEWRFAGDDTLPASRPLIHLPGGEGIGWAVDIPPFSATSWMLTMFVKVTTPATAPDETLLASINTTGSPVRRWQYSVNSGGTIFRGYNSSGGIETETLGLGPEFFDGWTQLALTIEQDGGNVDFATVYLTIGGNVFGGSGSIAGTVGVPTRIGSLTAGPGADGLSFGHVAITSGVGSGWLGWTDGANTGYLNEPAAARYGRLCREQGVRSKIIGDPANSTLMGTQPYGLGFLELLDECAAADMGLQGDQLPDWPGLTYRTRASLYNQTPVVLDHAARAIVPPYQPVRDDQRRRTDVTVRRPGGGFGRHTIPANAVYDESVEINAANDGQLPDLAAWKVHLGTDPGLRYPSATTDLVIAPQNAEAVRAIGQGDLVRLDNLPAGHPESSVDLIVEGVNPTVSGEGWTVELTSSSADRYRAGVIEDSVLGRPDTEGCELVSGVDADDTSWSVTTATGPSWIDSAAFAAMFPFDWLIAGERVTVTAITGTGAAQTATVIRAVNGVSKSHPAGAAISLADPMRALL